VGQGDPPGATQAPSLGLREGLVTEAPGTGEGAAGRAAGVPQEGPVVVPCEWEAFVAMLRERRADCRLHLEAV